MNSFLKTTSIILFIYIFFSAFFNHVTNKVDDYTGQSENSVIGFGIGINNRIGLSRLLTNENYESETQQKIKIMAEDYYKSSNEVLRLKNDITRLNKEIEQLKYDNSRIIRALRY